MNWLSVARARAITEPGMYRADPTLYLNVAERGSKSWVQRIAIKGGRRDIGLGSFALVTLAEAREACGIYAHARRKAVTPARNRGAARRRART